MSCSCHSTNGIHSPLCVECTLPVFARNNYFMGKLMVARDFTEEQRYFMGKDRRHNQLLHGSGTVCGLWVAEHPEPTCQDRWILVEPGVAVDCSGREINVRDQDCFDFRAAFEDWWHEAHGTNSNPDDKPHLLHLCLSYAECAVEEVPVLFDDTNCDDANCQPNRILESYRLSLRVDQPLPKHEHDDVSLDWTTTLNVSRAGWVRHHAATERVYVLTRTDPATLFVFESEHLSLVGSVAFTDAASDLEVSPDGSRVYVSLNAGADAEIHVIEATALPVTDGLTLTIAGTFDVRLLVAPDGTLYAFRDDLLQSYTLPTPLATVAPVVFTAPANLREVAVSSNSARIFAIDQTSDVKQLDVATPAGPATTALTLPAGEPLLARRFSTTGTPDNLALAVQTAATTFGIHVYATPSGGAAQDLGDGDIANIPVDLAVSPGGLWVYVLEHNAAGQGFVQAVNTHRMQLNQPNAVLPPVEVGANPTSIELTDDGQTLLVSFNGPDAEPLSGGVAQLHVSSFACDKLWERALEGCPACGDESCEDCLILATIEDYVYNSKVSQAAIDNLTDRKLLASTETITEVVKCLMEQGVGGGAGVQGPVGPDGPIGPDGPPGPGIDAVTAITVECDQPATAQISVIGGVRTLILEVPRGCDAPDPGPNPNPPPVALELAHIVAINWPHNGVIRPEELERDGLVIAFDDKIMAETLTEHSVEVQIRIAERHENMRFRTLCYCDIESVVSGLVVEADCDGFRTPIPPVVDDVNAGSALAVRVRPVNEDGRPVPFAPGEYRVLVHGDHIISEREIELPDGRKVHPAVDAEHIAPWLRGSIPPRAGMDPRCPTGDTAEGGLFESWFTVRQG